MGTLTHQDDLHMLYPALQRAASTNPEFRLGVIGVSAEKMPPWIDRIEIPDTATSYPRFVPWLREKTALFDFAVAPLQDTLFNAFKSPLKILDYAALGLPVLCSDIMVYQEIANRRRAPSWCATPRTRGRPS